MNPNPLLGVLYHWTGGLSAASCYLPFRAIQRWSWEVYWLLQGIFSWIIAPAVFAALLVPGWFQTIAHAPSNALLYAWFWGAMWGVGGLTFGLGVRYLGLALGYTLALGFSTAFGTLMPPLFAGQLSSIAHDRSGQVILLGVAICMAAIFVSGLAGLHKERELSAAHTLSTGAVREFSYRKGVIVATFAGIMSACFAYGLAAAKPVDALARAQLLQGGRSDLWQHLPGLVVVLWGGFSTNFLWCAWLLLKNRSAAQFAGRSAQGRIPTRVMARNTAACAAAGLLWYFQFFFYSMGQTRMGHYDFSSWTLHMAGTILFATLWGVVLHEWRGTTRNTRLLGAAGFLLLVLSTVVVGYGNYLKGS